jgi:cytochrome c
MHQWAAARVALRPGRPRSHCASSISASTAGPLRCGTTARPAEDHGGAPSTAPVRPDEEPRAGNGRERAPAGFAGVDYQLTYPYFEYSHHTDKNLTTRTLPFMQLTTNTGRGSARRTPSQVSCSARYCLAILILVVSGMSTAGRAHAADVAAAQSLAQKSGCFKCHGVEKGKDGPALRDAAAKYRGDPQAQQRLIFHVTSGEKVKFSDGHEEEHKKVKSNDPNETRNLVDWILSLEGGTKY